MDPQDDKLTHVVVDHTRMTRRQLLRPGAAGSAGALLMASPLAALPASAQSLAWTPRTPLRVARGGLASATADGRVYAIGGFSTDFAATHDSVEAYDPSADSWQLVAPMLTPRGNPAAAAIDTRVYAIGGFAPKVGTDRVEVFDPSANRWARVARLPVALTGPGAVAFKGRSSPRAAVRKVAPCGRSTFTTRRPTAGAAMRRRCRPHASC